MSDWHVVTDADLADSDSDASTMTRRVRTMSREFEETDTYFLQEAL